MALLGAGNPHHRVTTCRRTDRLGAPKGEQSPTKQWGGDGARGTQRAPLSCITTITTMPNTANTISPVQSKLPQNSCLPAASQAEQASTSPAPTQRSPPTGGCLAWAQYNVPFTQPSPGVVSSQASNHSLLLCVMGGRCCSGTGDPPTPRTAAPLLAAESESDPTCPRRTDRVQVGHTYRMDWHRIGAEVAQPDLVILP